MSFPGFPGSTPPSPGVPPTPSPIGHNLLSATHLDTIPSGAAAGGLIRGNASGLWEQLPIAAEGLVLTVLSGQAEWQAATGGLIRTVESGTTATFNVSTNYYNALTSGVSTVNLPSPATLGQEHVLKDIDGTAGGANIIVNGNGNTIDGNATTLIDANYESIRLILGPTEWNII